jgi:hypothetical protein
VFLVFVIVYSALLGATDLFPFPLITCWQRSDSYTQTVTGPQIMVVRGWRDCVLAVPWAAVLAVRLNLAIKVYAWTSPSLVKIKNNRLSNRIENVFCYLPETYDYSVTFCS